MERERERERDSPERAPSPSGVGVVVVRKTGTPPSSSSDSTLALAPAFELEEALIADESMSKMVTRSPDVPPLEVLRLLGGRAVKCGLLALKVRLCSPPSLYPSFTFSTLR